MEAPADYYKNFVLDVMQGGVDTDLQSRAIATYGSEAMAKFASLRVLIVGMNGLGAEVAKNVILTGVNEVVFYGIDMASPHDLASQFFLRPEDYGQDRASACLSRFKELNG